MSTRIIRSSLVFQDLRKLAPPGWLCYFGGMTTLRRELLDHVLVLGQGHLERLLREFVDAYYHLARPHQGLAGDTPVPQEKPPENSVPSKLVSIPILGGLHHSYVRVAA